MNTAIEYDGDAAIPYSSLSSLREAHTQLLKSYRSGERDGVFAEIEAFLRQAKATGALLDSEGDRGVSQSLMDYWVTVLYRASRTPPEATLAEFDPSLAPSLDDNLCPYVGLNAFQEEQREAFFGRQCLIDQMVGLLGETRLLFVVGPSGSGKSSLILAGLLPLLRKGRLPGSENWRYFARTVPGSNPLKNLARTIGSDDARSSEWIAEQVQELRKNPGHLRSLLSTGANVPSVIVVDQFEELFTLCADAGVREAFIDNLVNVAQEPNPPGTIILTMRSDFETQIVLFPELMKLAERGQVRATPLTATDLHEAIQQPARRIGLKFADGIIQELVRDILGEAAGLPLLQFALLRLWKAREKNRVTWDAYKKLGSARLALGRAADELYSSLIIEDQRAVRGVFLRLVRPGELTNEFTSNRVKREALYSVGANYRIDRVLEKLIGAGLIRLTKGDKPQLDQVEVAHEALVRNWPTLVDWLDDERTKLRQRLRLTTAAEQWIEHDRDPGGLLGGSLLEEALTYKDLNIDEDEFVRASLAAVQQAEQEKEAVQARERELDQARVLAIHQRAEEVAQHAARTRRFAVILAVVAVAAVLFALGAFAQRRQALAEGKRAEEQAKLASDRSKDLQVAIWTAEDRRKEAESATDLANRRLVLLAASSKKLQAAIATAEARRKEAESATRLANYRLVASKRAEALAVDEKNRADSETLRAKDLSTELAAKVEELKKFTAKTVQEKEEADARDELNRTATMVLRQASPNKDELNDAVKKLVQVHGLYRKYGKRVGEEDTLSTLSTAYRKLDDNDNARKIYDQAMQLYREDVENQTKALRPGSVAIVDAIGRLGEFFVAQSEHPKAAVLYKEALNDIQGKLLAGMQEAEAYGAVDSYDRYIKKLGEVYRQQSNYDEIETLYEQAFEVKNKILKPDSFGLYQAANELAQFYRDRKRFSEAESYLEKAKAMAEKALGPDDDTYVLNSLRSLGSLYREERKYDKAEPLYEKALSNLEKRSKKVNVEVVTESMNDLAFIYQRENKYDQAETLYQRSITLYQQSPEKFQSKLNATQASLAGVYRDQKKFPESEQLYNQVAANLEKESKGQDTPELAAVLNELGDVTRNLRKYDEAKKLYERALKVYQKEPKRFQNNNLAATYIDFVALYRDQGNNVLANQYFEKARQAIPTRNIDNLVRFFADQGEYDEVRLVYDGEFEFRERVNGAGTPQVLDILNQAGKFFKDQKKYDEAEHYYREALNIVQRVYGPDDAFLLVNILNNLASIYRNEKMHSQAEALYKQALNNLEKNEKGGNPSRIAETLKNYAQLLQDMGQGDRAAELLQRAKVLSGGRTQEANPN